jgi:hypothetical protein
LPINLPRAVPSRGNLVGLFAVSLPDVRLWPNNEFAVSQVAVSESGAFVISSLRMDMSENDSGSLPGYLPTCSYQSNGGGGRSLAGTVYPSGPVVNVGPSAQTLYLTVTVVRLF